MPSTTMQTPEFNPAADALPEPEDLEAEIETAETRRERLREKVQKVESRLEDARERLQSADSDEAREKALSDAKDLQATRDTIEGALEDLTAEIESHRERLSMAREAQKGEDRLQALAEKGREAVEARAKYEAVREEIVEVLKKKAPELARRFREWLDAADDFRSALVNEESHVYERPSSTTKADRERAEGLISELKERGVARMKDALAPHHTSIPAPRWMGWSHENGYSGPDGPLREAVESIREFGNQSSSQSDE